jgi:hypothetical protein
MAGAAAAPMVGAAGTGLGGLGALGGMSKGISGSIAEAPQTIGQQAASTMQNMGLGERLLYAVPHSLKNMAVVGTTGVLAGMGTSSAARSIATVAPLSSHNTVSQGIGRANAARQVLAQENETSTALQEANQSIGTHIFNAATASTPDADFLTSQAPALNRWHVQQSQIAPAQFLSQARQNHVINVRQYQALAKDPRAQAELTETYKVQLNTISERDTIGNLTKESLGRTANLKNAMEGAQGRGLKATLARTQPELADV